MEKMKIGIYCYLIADILTQNLQNCSLSSSLLNLSLLFKPLNLIGCHGNRKAEFENKQKNKNHPLRSHKGNDAETLRNCS